MCIRDSDRMDYLEDESVSNYNHIIELEESLKDDCVKDDDTEERVN